MFIVHNPKLKNKKTQQKVKEETSIRIINLKAQNQKLEVKRKTPKSKGQIKDKSTCQKKTTTRSTEVKHKAPAPV